MTTIIKATFLKSWKNNTIAAYFVGLGILHPLIAHGITGDHEKLLTTPEFFMHSISLICFAVLLTLAQNKSRQQAGAGKLYTGLLPLAVLIFTAFWLGYYTLYIPFDILFMLMAIGTYNGLALKGSMKHPKRWLWQSLVAHFAGAVAGILVGLGGYLLFLKDLTGLTRDFAVWIGISVPAGFTVALISGWFLSRQIQDSPEVKESTTMEGTKRVTTLSAELARM